MAKFRARLPCKERCWPSHEVRSPIHLFKEAKLQQPKRMGSALKWGGTGVSLVVLQISHGGIKCSSLPVDRELRKGSKEKGT